MEEQNGYTSISKVRTQRGVRDAQQKTKTQLGLFGVISPNVKIIKSKRFTFTFLILQQLKKKYRMQENKIPFVARSSRSGDQNPMRLQKPPTVIVTTYGKEHFIDPNEPEIRII